MSNQKVSRNDACPCGSGRKYKQCCGLVKQLAPKVAQSLRAAWNLFRQGFISDAEKLAQELLSEGSKVPDAWHLLASIALQQGQTKEAVDYSRQAIKLNQKNPEYFNNLGLAYHEQGKLEEAIKSYRNALAIDTKYADGYYNLHAALLDSNNLKPAIDALQKTVNISPADIEAKFMLGILLDSSGAEAEASKTLLQLEHFSPLYQARIDAWRYLKSSTNKLPTVMGSAVQTFRHAFSQANPDGLVLEFGVRFGNSIRMLAELAKQEIYGFDSFEGLPDVWHHEPKGSYTTKGVVPEVPENVKLHVGWFDSSLPKFLAENEGPVRLVNIDCDIYSSTKTVLDLLAPRMVTGSVIIFDEYIGNEHWREDEFKAFQEAVKSYGWSYEYISFSFFTKQVAVRIISA